MQTLGFVNEIEQLGNNWRWVVRVKKGFLKYAGTSGYMC